MVLTRAKRRSLTVDQYDALITAREKFRKNVAAHLAPLTELDRMNYTVLKQLGKGGFGTVYKARDTDGNIVALKVQEKTRIRASRLGTVLATNEKAYLFGLKSEFVVKFCGTWRSASYLVMVLEFAPYGDFFGLVKEGPLPENRSLFYFAQVACALQFLHASSIIFSDLKPENCLIFAKGRVKLGDFGLSRYGMAPDIGCVASLPYTAPEVLMNTNVTHMLDWWSFGAMIHTMLLSYTPFAGFKDDQEQAIAKLAPPDPLPLPRLEESSLTPAAKDLIRGFLTKDLTKRLGAVGNANEVMDHRWFNGVDFIWVRSSNFEIPGFDLPEREGKDCQWDGHKTDGAEELDPNYKDFLQF